MLKKAYFLTHDYINFNDDYRNDEICMYYLLTRYYIHQNLPFKIYNNTI